MTLGGSGKLELKLHVRSYWSVAVLEVVTVQRPQFLDGIEALSKWTVAATEGVVAIRCGHEVPHGVKATLGGALKRSNKLHSEVTKLKNTKEKSRR